MCLEQMGGNPGSPEKAVDGLRFPVGPRWGRAAGGDQTQSRVGRGEVEEDCIIRGLLLWGSLVWIRVRRTRKEVRTA